jgi:poly(3-hydroxybutyrate) depolymerase
MRFALAVCVALLAACASEVGQPGRLTARPHQHNAVVAMRGELLLGMGGARDGRLYVPRRVRASYPLMLLLHGATGRGERIERRLQDLAEEFGFIILAPDSRGSTWDVGHGALGPDVEFIDRTLKDVFTRYPIDTSLGRVRIGAAGGTRLSSTWMIEFRVDRVWPDDPRRRMNPTTLWLTSSEA